MRTAFSLRLVAAKAIVAFMAWGAPVAGAAPAAESPAFRNPMIWADVPDESIVRVGDSYYMSSTTMHLSPGLPIMKSRDLSNWEIVGYAYPTLADNAMLRQENGASAYGKGSWASSLRYHDGAFYVSTLSATTGRTHVYSTRDVAKGPWKESSFAPALHDHSLFFDDDGRVYMVHGGGQIKLVELDAGLIGLKPGGVNQVIIPDATAAAGGVPGLRAEGSQLFKVGGKYYLFNITWPKGGMRTEIVHRADKITGPYEGRVVLQDQGIAQGGIVEGPRGGWIGYLFKDSGAVGRVPYLVPVKWEDGWPVFGENGKVPATMELPAVSRLSNLVASDEFDRKPGDRLLPLAWQWNHNPDDSRWSLTARPGALRITTGRVDRELPEARNILTQRTFGPECAGSIAIDTRQMKDGDFSGLAAFQQQYGFAGVKMEGGSKSIVMVSAAGGSPKELATVPLVGDVVHLKIECDFRERADKATFYCSADGRKWQRLGPDMKMTYTLPHFMGYRFALFNFATKSAGGYVDFQYFHVSDKPTGGD